MSEVKKGKYSANRIFSLASSLKNGVEISDDDCRGLLHKIEQEIHTSPNRARLAMNNALIAIGVYKPAFSANKSIRKPLMHEM